MWVFRHEDLHMFDRKLKKKKFHSLDVVGRGSETQLQVGGNCNYLI